VDANWIGQVAASFVNQISSTPITAMSLVLAFWGAILSTYLALKRREDDQIDIRVLLSEFHGWDYQECRIDSFEFSAQNHGKRTVVFDSFWIMLDHDGKQDKMFYIKDGDLKHDKNSYTQYGSLKNEEFTSHFPYELLPERSLTMAFDYDAFFDHFKNPETGEDNIPQNCKLVANFKDQLGNIYKSYPKDLF
jgi:hypothetical protein